MEQCHHCKNCPYKSKLLFQMLRHVRLHRTRAPNFRLSCAKHGPEKYFCPHCDFRTDLSGILKYHIIGLHKEHTYSSGHYDHYKINGRRCRRCDFQTYSVLVMAKHAGECYSEVVTKKTREIAKWRKCEHCTFTSMNKDHIHKHIIDRHTKEEGILWYNCETCNYKSKRKVNLKRHVDCVHRKRKNTRHGCKHCTFSSINMDHIRKHIIDRHTKEEDILWYNCEICNYRSKRKVNLNRHVDCMHLKRKNTVSFKCLRCLYVTGKYKDLRNHVIAGHRDKDVGTRVLRGRGIGKYRLEKDILNKRNDVYMWQSKVQKKK